MSNRTKWLLAVMIALLALSLAGIALANRIYLPVVRRGATATATATPRAEVYIASVEADPPGPDLEGEYVTIRNATRSSVSLTGWTLLDTTKTKFTFPSFTLAAGKDVKVWSKFGTNTQTDVYWGLSAAIWGNLKDCAYLYDRDGRRQDEHCYERTP